MSIKSQHNILLKHFQGCFVARKGKQDTENLKYGSDNFPNGAWSMFRSLYIIWVAHLRASSYIMCNLRLEYKGFVII